MRNWEERGTRGVSYFVPVKSSSRRSVGENIECPVVHSAWVLMDPGTTGDGERFRDEFDGDCKKGSEPEFRGFDLRLIADILLIIHHDDTRVSSSNQAEFFFRIVRNSRNSFAVHVTPRSTFVFFPRVNRAPTPTFFRILTKISSNSIEDDRDRFEGVISLFYGHALLIKNYSGGFQHGAAAKFFRRRHNERIKARISEPRRLDLMKL